MRNFAKIAAVCLFSVFPFLFSACEENVRETPKIEPNSPVPTGEAENRQEMLLSVEKNETSSEPVGKFDFKNYVYPLPAGWQGAGIKEITLNGGAYPMNKEHVGATFVGTKFGDVTGDGREEAMVVVKIETGGSANPQIVYVFEWRKEKPAMIAYFRTGDRADGGLKDLRAENGELVVQLYGQDRYLIGELETMKIPGDEEQICCPTYFTRTRYKWDGNVFKLQGKRETYSITDKNAPPAENMLEIVKKENGAKK